MSKYTKSQITNSAAAWAGRQSRGMFEGVALAILWAHETERSKSERDAFKVTLTDNGLSDATAKKVVSVAYRAVDEYISAASFDSHECTLAEARDAIVAAITSKYPTWRAFEESQKTGNGRGGRTPQGNANAEQAERAKAVTEGTADSGETTAQGQATYAKVQTDAQAAQLVAALKAGIEANAFSEAQLAEIARMARDAMAQQQTSDNAQAAA